MTINNQDEREALKSLAMNIVNQILDGAVEEGGYVLQDMKKRQAFNDVADAFVTELLAANFHRNVGAVSVESPDLDALLKDADALVESWDRRGSWKPDEPVGMVWRLANYLRRGVVPSPAPSVVTTVEELEALPDDTAFRDEMGRVWLCGHGGFMCAGSEDLHDSEAVDLPATVLTPTSPPPSEVLTYDGTNRAQVREFFRKYDVPYYSGESIGTDYGYQRDPETGLPIGEPALRPGDMLIAGLPVAVIPAPPSEVRVTGEQVEAMVTHMSGVTCSERDAREVIADLLAAAGIPVAGEES